MATAKAGAAAAIEENPCGARGVHRCAKGSTAWRRRRRRVLGQDPFSGHVFCFRGRRGDLVKLLWWDGDGLCLFAKRLERGRFVWPRAEDRAWRC